MNGSVHPPLCPCSAGSHLAFCMPDSRSLCKEGRPHMEDGKRSHGPSVSLQKRLPISSDWDALCPGPRCAEMLQGWGQGGGGAALGAGTSARPLNYTTQLGSAAGL